MAEFSKGGRFSEGLRFAADVLAGVPSIVLGYVCFLALVIYLNFGYSPMAAGIALAIIMFPYIFRTTEIAIKKVPNSIKEGAIALGSTKTTMINRLVLRFALPGHPHGHTPRHGDFSQRDRPSALHGELRELRPDQPVPFAAGVPDGRHLSLLHFEHPVRRQLSYVASFLLIMIVLALNVVARLGLKRFSKV